MDEKVCRLCCSSSGSHHIFDPSVNYIIFSKITYCCTNVSISQNDGLPTHICDSCSAELNACYEFILKCEHTDKQLRRSFKEIEIKVLSSENSLKVEKQEYYFNDDFADRHSYEVPLDYNERLLELDLISPKDYACKKKEKPKKYKREKGPEICTICNKELESYSALIVHRRLHSDAKQFSCKPCNKTYKAKTSLLKHIERHHTERKRDHICSTCGKGFYSKADIDTHMRTHTGETPFECKVCSAKFSQQSSLIRHELRHTDIKHHSCPECAKSFRTKEEVKNHQMVHTTEKRYMCPMCGGQFKYKSSLSKHMAQHNNKFNFVCNYCGRAFSTKGNLKSHIDRQHSEKSGQCIVCMKNVPNIEVHMRNHTGEKPLKCELCASSFTKANGLAHHVNFRHKNSEKFKCSYAGCDEKFPTRPMLLFHEAKIHGTGVSHPCTLCPRGFYRKNDLARHMIGTHKEKLK